MGMKKWILGFIIIILIVGCSLKSGWTQSVSELGVSPKELIERLTRIEENQKNLQRQIDDNQKNLQRQIDDNQKSLQRQIDELKNVMMWGFGMMWTGMLALMGFILWDRRTALLPTIHALKELVLQQKKIELALQQYATKEIRFAQAMQVAGLL
ncbi:MAG: hypothetical protein QME42_07380 [bacterium]|nr:hypothetical protein [bacterium]